ncbi:uncharacterized protein LTR77_011062 [Saxophila tyrrhenica]|uniref:Uncharacterized protein n=1 Tax=Saxophila tyrrhenica TaxID=1690608 RepID=A0AAV9NWW0_9PEZI|nr:hypothetical protein LTR77_011062 [Saxophila tyrrhenica]
MAASQGVLHDLSRTSRPLVNFGHSLPPSAMPEKSTGLRHPGGLLDRSLAAVINMVQMELPSAGAVPIELATDRLSEATEMAHQPQNILVFGATGLIGGYITNALLAAKHNFGSIGIFTSQGSAERKKDLFDAYRAKGASVIIR